MKESLLEQPLFIIINFHLNALRACKTMSLISLNDVQSSTDNLSPF